MRAARPSLAELARLHGVVPVYRANDGSVKVVGDETLSRVLASLGVGDVDRADAARERRLRLWREVLPPVVTSWLPGPIELELRLPEGSAGRVGLEVTLEDGSTVDLGEFESRTVAERVVEGERFRRARIVVGDLVPEGYHSGSVQVGGSRHRFHWFVAPERAHPTARGATGLFVPLYALHSDRRRDCADFEDHARLAEWAAGLGVRYVGTLPLCAAFLEPPVEPSPYAPVSRLFWNEAYLDFEALPELASTDVAELLAREVRAAPADPDHVDWPAVAERRRRAIDACAERAFAPAPAERDPALRSYVERRPEAESFARFRACSERFGRNWRDWPDDAVADEAAFRHHLYAQWRTQEQVDRLLERMRAAGGELYLDLPLGVHPDGYDAWAYRDEFLSGCSTGAPPDPFFTRGQDWGFSPLHPEGSRARAHRYFRACLRHQLAHCGLLRIDHVMGLNRLWCVPHGMSADQGCYVRQPAEELWAIVTLESRRHRCAVAGEDLGTVPVATSRALERHGVLSMQVLQFDLAPGNIQGCLDVRPGKLATPNTHDMPPFAAWWNADDVDDRVDLGLLDDEGAAVERLRRRRLTGALAFLLESRGAALADRGADAALHATLLELAQSDADVLVMALEDMWSETRTQNVPGTGSERRNWQRRTRPSLERIRSDEDLRAKLVEIVRARGGGPDGC